MLCDPERLFNFSAWDVGKALTGLSEAVGPISRKLRAIFSLSVLMVLATSGGALAAEAVELPKLEPSHVLILQIVLASAILSLLYGLYLVVKVLRIDPGPPEMQRVAEAIREGAMTYLGRQFKTMIWFVVAITIGLYLLYRPVYAGTHIPQGVAIAFLMGVFASYGAGLVGMYMAVRGNVRTANAALTSFKGALETAFQSGTVSGMFTVGLGLLGATVIFLIFREDAMKVLIGFGFGACLAALFMRVGGGIYTKAADVGADLVGKIEKGIPEDDPRNAATVADNVGDNVGDCAGMAADVFESYEVTLVAAIILGAAAAAVVGADVMKLIMYAFLVRAVGVVASIVGTWTVRGKDIDTMDPMQPINVGFFVSAGVAVLGFGLISYYYLDGVGGFGWYAYFGATLMGIILALFIGKLTEHFTSTEKQPVTEIAHATRTGPATLILTGFSTGLESSVWAIVGIAATIFGSMAIFHGNPALSAYGIALSGLGLLTTTGFILAMDTFGPISDNANGIFEMSGALKEEKERGDERAGKIVHKLDAVGNTTKALTKGFAIATAVIAAVALFRSFMEDAHLLESGLRIDWPEVFIGILIGGAVPFLFSSFAIKAVSRAAFLVVEEVRRQFREIPGIMEGTATPEYSRCVAISTAAAQKELLAPAILALATPILVAFGLGYKDPSKGAAALGGYLVGAILTGQLMAVLMANAGGAWDNAKKKIEDGLFGGKGTEYHKAAVIGDTVGDPFKDTAGPGLNPLIKVMNLVAILIAPIAITPIAPVARLAVVLVTLGALVAAVIFSKRGAITSMEEVEPYEAGGDEAEAEKVEADTAQ